MVIFHLVKCTFTLSIPPPPLYHQFKIHFPICQSTWWKVFSSHNKRQQLKITPDSRVRLQIISWKPTEMSTSYLHLKSDLFMWIFCFRLVDNILCDGWLMTFLMFFTCALKRFHMGNVCGFKCNPSGFQMLPHRFNMSIYVGFTCIPLGFT